MEEHLGTIVKLENVHKTYMLGIEGVAALRGVSLEIDKGEFIILLGKSGGGKTTVLNLIGTIDRPTRGTLSLCGHKIAHNTTDKTMAALRLSKIGFVFQTFNLISTMNAFENVCLPMILLGKLSATQIKDRAIMLLTKVGLAHRLKHMPSMMSGGEQQRVTIARALANEPEILLLDEPTGDLDSKSSAIVMEMLFKLNVHEKITLIMVTHDVALKRFGNRVFHMLDGKLQREEFVSKAVRMSEYIELRRTLKRMRKGGMNSDVRIEYQDIEIPNWASQVDLETAQGLGVRVALPLEIGTTEDELIEKDDDVLPDITEVGRTRNCIFETRWNNEKSYGDLYQCMIDAPSSSSLE